MVVIAPSTPINRSLVQCCAHIGVGELHPLRVTGRARGVELNNIVVRIIIAARIRVRLRVAPISKTGPVGMVEIHGDDTAYLRALVDNFLDQGRIITVDKNHLGLRIIDDEGHLGRCKPRIDTDQCCTCFLNTQQ